MHIWVQTVHVVSWFPLYHVQFSNVCNPCKWPPLLDLISRIEHCKNCWQLNSGSSPCTSGGFRLNRVFLHVWCVTVCTHGVTLLHALTQSTMYCRIVCRVRCRWCHTCGGLCRFGCAPESDGVDTWTLNVPVTVAQRSLSDPYVLHWIPHAPRVIFCTKFALCISKLAFLYLRMSKTPCNCIPSTPLPFGALWCTFRTCPSEPQIGHFTTRILYKKQVVEFDRCNGTAYLQIVDRKRQPKLKRYRH